MSLTSALHDWIDLAWAMPVIAITPPRHRFIAVGYILCCMIMLRLLIELMESLDFEHGFLPWMDATPWYRGQMVFGVGHLVFMGIAFISAEKERATFMAAAITVFFGASMLALLTMLI